MRPFAALRPRWFFAGFAAMFLALPTVIAQGEPAPTPFERVFEDPAGDNGAAGPDWTDIRQVIVRADGHNVSFEIHLSALPELRSFYQVDLLPYGWQYLAGCELGPHPDGDDPGPWCTLQVYERAAEGLPAPSVSTEAEPIFVEVLKGMPAFQLFMPYEMLGAIATTAIEAVQVGAAHTASTRNAGSAHPDRTDEFRSEVLDWTLPARASPVPSPQPWFPRAFRFNDAMGDDLGRVPGSDVRAVTLTNTGLELRVEMELDVMPASRAIYQINVVTAGTIHNLVCGIGMAIGSTVAEPSCTWTTASRTSGGTTVVDRITAEVGPPAVVIGHVPFDLFETNMTVRYVIARACLTLSYDVETVGTGYTCAETADEAWAAPWWRSAPTPPSTQAKDDGAPGGAANTARGRRDVPVEPGMAALALGVALIARRRR